MAILLRLSCGLLLAGGGDSPTFSGGKLCAVTEGFLGTGGIGRGRRPVDSVPIVFTESVENSPNAPDFGVWIMDELVIDVSSDVRRVSNDLAGVGG